MYAICDKTFGMFYLHVKKHYLIARDATFSVGLSNPSDVWHPTFCILSGDCHLSWHFIGHCSTQFWRSLLLGHECPKTSGQGKLVSIFFLHYRIFFPSHSVWFLPSSLSCLPFGFSLLLPLHKSLFFFLLVAQPPITTTIDNPSSSPQVIRTAQTQWYD
jgi:hypothetical protein